MSATIVLPIHTQPLGQSIKVARSYLFIRCVRQHIRINFIDIIYIESAGNYVKFYLKDRSYLSIMTIKALATMLPKELFFKINRAVIVNISMIAVFDKESAKLETGQEFSFGEGRYRELVKSVVILKK